MKIFWSWQSDNYEKSGRYFVSEVLTKVALDLNGADGIDEALRDDNLGPVEVDHDTKGIAGTPPIADTILQKIREAAVFVADVTPVGQTGHGKHLANPNVMIELGYAIKALGHHRIVLVMNKAEHGTLETLPFDLRYLRGPVIYELAATAAPDVKQLQKKLLAAALRVRIQPAIEYAINALRESKRMTVPAPEFNLSLIAPSGTLPEVISQNVPQTLGKSLNDIKASFPKLPVPDADPPPRPRHLSSLHAMGIFPHRPIPTHEWTREEVNGYNRRVDFYYALYERYLLDLEEYQRFRQRTLNVQLRLENTGTLPATNIDVEFDLADGLSLFEAKKLPAPPEEPTPPNLDPKPRIIEYAVPTKITLTDIDSPHRWTRVEPDRRHVRFHVAELKHGYNVSSDTFVISFVSGKEIGYKELPYSISVNECPQSTDGFLPLRVTLADD